MDTFLNPQQRDRHLAEMADGELDVLVIGAGVTGAGIALDAATRGLRTAVVDAQDYAAGTSSRSSRLVHGGLRYLYQLDFALVAEALRERGLLLTTTAPHLVKAQPLLWPFQMPVVERAYSAVGVGLYDALALAGSRGRKTVPLQRHLSKTAALEKFPALDPDSLVGAMEYYDARVDDARLVVTLLRTACAHGALVANRASVVEMLTEGERVVGARIKDLESGTEREVRARHVINATGVWTEQTQSLAHASGGLRVLASKGIHLLVPRERIQADRGLFLRTEKSVLFIIPWPRYWVIGTTDTAWHEDLRHPVATSADIDYVLDHANAVLADKLTRDDVIGTYAGLRPLLQPGVLDEGSSTKVSREHTVTEAAPGLTVIAGGKLTTYRAMAEDAVDFALGDEATERPSVTARTPLVGASGYEAYARRAERECARRGIDAGRVPELLERYGTDLDSVLALIDEDPGLAAPLGDEPAYLRAEVAFACLAEGAMHLEDVLTTRVRLASERRDRGLGAVEEVAEIIGTRLGWTLDHAAWEKQSYRDRVAAEQAAEAESTDDAAAARLGEAADLLPMA